MQIKYDTNKPVTEGNVLIKVGIEDWVSLANINGTVTYNHGPLPKGSYYITALYNGTATYDQSTVRIQEDIKLTGSNSQMYLILIPSYTNPDTCEIVLYTFKIGNRGPDVVHNAVMNQVIPEGFEFVGASVDVGHYTYDVSTRTITWYLGDVPVGDPYMWAYLRVINSSVSLPNLTFSIGTDNSTKNDVKAQEVVSKENSTIKMQETGLSMPLLFLAILAVLGGLLVPKRK
ncbi:hypothetical protein [Methanobacterium sp. ACI-7]|uniref:hypothetical protein n=1 Tax=unclassified Methanobacterium TaxID=2627676 RepID=UPI0039C094E3